MALPDDYNNAPEVIVVGKRSYHKVLCLVHTKRPDGKTPALLTAIQPDLSVDLQGGEEFVVAYMRDSLSKVGKQK